jgi:hypothetical protein
MQGGRSPHGGGRPRARSLARARARARSCPPWAGPPAKWGPGDGSPSTDGPARARPAGPQTAAAAAAQSLCLCLSDVKCGQHRASSQAARASQGRTHCHLAHVTASTAAVAFGCGRRPRLWGPRCVVRRLARPCLPNVCPRLVPHTRCRHRRRRPLSLPRARSQIAAARAGPRGARGAPRAKVPRRARGRAPRGRAPLPSRAFGPRPRLSPGLLLRAQAMAPALARARQALKRKTV